eukprot:GFKZ01013086.1.p1 GENE.GFKZ01013086.1~~GFKZ01013086.1.p1  ORF type:complete len:629 (+),score=82.16 GFKZ01013086.1:167-2053(+)
MRPARQLARRLPPVKRPVPRHTSPFAKTQPRTTRPSLPRSSLGLRRISECEPSQILRATPADICRLRAATKLWHIPSFDSWPLLLRAITHPSMSNWAERALRLEKKSLGPHALELLGDRVVGVCVAKRALEWIADGSMGRKQGLEEWAWKYGATSMVGAMTGNRGMAWVSRQIGIEELMRWEKALPPAVHRERITGDGVDVMTGIGVNREVNALAAAYEAVVAAVYLDGGMEMSETFVGRSLLASAARVGVENKSTREFEVDVLREVCAWVGVRLWDVWMWGKGGTEEVGKALGEVELKVVDLEETGIELAPSPVYYAGVVLRKKGQKEVAEEQLVSLSSHFSVEMARNAALIMAKQFLRGEKEEQVGQKGGKGPVKRMVVKGVEDATEGTMDVRMDAGGNRWYHEGDYGHLQTVLAGIGVEGVGREKNQVQKMAETRRKDEADKLKEMERLRNLRGPPCQEGVDLGSGKVCEKRIAQCLAFGEVADESCDLLDTHGHLRGGEGADRVTHSIGAAIERLSDMERKEQLGVVRGLNCVGQHAYRLWSVQRSMKRVGQSRAEIMEDSLRRLGKMEEIEKVMYGGEGLEGVDRVLRVRSGLFALGVCANEVGIKTAMRWLSGAEVMAGKEA